jgi:hypothetical protein
VILVVLANLRGQQIGKEHDARHTVAGAFYLILCASMFSAEILQVSVVVGPLPT